LSGRKRARAGLRHRAQPGGGRLARTDLDAGKEDPAERGLEIAALRGLERAREGVGEVDVERGGLRRREEVRWRARGPALGKVLEQRVVLDRDAQAVVRHAGGTRDVDVGRCDHRDAGRARGRGEVEGGAGPAGRRGLGRLEVAFLVALLLGGRSPPVREREVDVPRRAEGGRALGAARAQRGGGDRGEERARVDAAVELDEEARVVGEEDEALLEARRALDQAEALRPVESRPGDARIGAERARGDELAEILVALRALDERDEASGLAGGIRDLGSDDRAEGPAGALAQAPRGEEEVDEAGKRVDVGEREPGEAERGRALDERGGRVDARQHRVVPVDAQGEDHGGRSGPRPLPAPDTLTEH